MRLAVEFKRYGAARYVSHLDMQRAVMRAIRRTKLEPEYSAGFNPHMLLSFASAMPVGLESDCEFFELKLVKETSLDFCLSELIKAMPDGIAPLWTGKLDDTAPKLMAALRFAGYELTVEEKYFEPVKLQFENLLQLDKIEVEIERKGSAAQKDIRPLICSVKTERAPVFNMILAFSSEGTLNPEVLMKAVTDNLKAAFDYSVKRTGLYVIKDGSLASLKDLCG